MDQKQKILLWAYIHAVESFLVYFIIIFCLGFAINGIIVFLLQNPDFLLGDWGRAVFLSVTLIIFLMLSFSANKEYREKMDKYQGHLFTMKECPVCKSELFLGKCWKKCGVQWETPEEEE